jgi:hypothetical protein
MSQVVHSLVGYNRETERVSEEFDVPDAALPRARQLAQVLDDDPEAIRCYSLDAAGARDLAALLDVEIDPGRNDYFLEGFAYEFAGDGMFRPDGSGWSVWIHNDAEKKHVKIIVARATLDDYVSSHGLGNHRTAVQLLNARIDNKVREIVNRAIDHDRAATCGLELSEDDLAAIFDE